MKINDLEYKNNTEKNIEFAKDNNNFHFCNHEIVRWQEYNGKKSCYTIASWEKGKEGYYMVVVGNRLFNDEIDYNEFMVLASYVQKILDATFKIEEYINENT